MEFAEAQPPADAIHEQALGAFHYAMAEDAYARWQGIRITHLGTCINLFLTYAVAALGFSLHLLNEPRFPSANGPAAILLIAAVILGLLSTIFGAGCCVNRLWDFRLTARIVRIRKRRKETTLLTRCDGKTR